MTTLNMTVPGTVMLPRNRLAAAINIRCHEAPNAKHDSPWHSQEILVRD
ncbi:MAG: hypothetical protein KC481_12315 [Acidimicrobiaceae bacterium]|nr:hypothetical protein [bacterium]MCO4834441.1 hypothetical protein [Acidimicrobiaceae bacterium]MDC1389790.1 hypothetical protein [Acidimicrobiales bacterium]